MLWALTCSETPLLRFDDLTLGYERHPAVHHISGDVQRGELLAVVGPNGAGKSTLLKGIVGELKPLGGSIDRDGLGRSDIAYLPQQIDIDRSFPISVFDCVAMGLWRKIGAFGALSAADHTSVHRALADARPRRAFPASGGNAVGRTVPARACSRGCCSRTLP